MAVERISKIERENIKLTFVKGDVKCLKGGKVIPLKPEQAGYPAGYGPPSSYYEAMKKNAFNGLGVWDVTTGKDSSATFFLCNDTLGKQTGKIYIRLEANSSIKITVTAVDKLIGADETWTVVECTTRESVLYKDPDIVSLETFDSVWSVLSRVNTKFLKDKVVEEGRSTNDKDKLAARIIAVCTSATGISSACSGFIGGPLSVVLEVANITAQWVLKTNMAYSLKCVYMPTAPTTDRFKSELLLLLGGQEAVKEAINDAAKSIKDSAKEAYDELNNRTSVKDDIKADILDSPAFKKVEVKIMDNLRKKLGAKLAEKLAKSAKKIIPLAPAIYSVISDTKETATLGKEAQNFYKVAAVPTVTKVTVSPSPVTVKQGSTKQFSAVVTGNNSPAKTVKWSLTGAASGTSINDKGLLTVGANQSPGTLTVKATSTADSSKSGAATVTVPALLVPTVTKVTVSPTSVTAKQGTTKQFSAIITGNNNPAKTVKWSLSGAGSGTSINDKGLLTVGANQSPGTLTVKATSTADSSKSGTTTVTVPAPPAPTPPKPAPTPSNKIPYPCPTSSVKSGLKGDSVKWVQWSLNKIMNSGLTVDGSCGQKTVDAIKAFQKKHSLTVDGSFGSDSRKKMISLLSAKGWS